MKQIFVTLAMVAFFIACNQSDTGNTTSETEGPAADTAAGEPTASAGGSLEQNPDYQKGLELEAKSDCSTCHKLDERLVGPSFKEIAQKYANADAATIDSLAGKIIKGGAGNWGQVPMTPHPTISEEDAKTLVRYVLLLK